MALGLRKELVAKRPKAEKYHQRCGRKFAEASRAQAVWTLVHSKATSH